MRTIRLMAAGLLVFAACGGKSDVNLGDDGDGGTDFLIDADPNAPDAGPSAGCTPGGVQCNNCVDDDGDGLADGFDPHCTGVEDDDEGSFATGIPGDNQDSVWQDCFFDGNSGAGNDGCDGPGDGNKGLHVCCFLPDPCPEDLKPDEFDRDNCTLSGPSAEKCAENCGPLTPPGCDCFGCCTVCADIDDASVCVDMVTNPAATAECDLPNADGSFEELLDPTQCFPCTKIAECQGPECNPEECVLCPGQTLDDLPDSCDMMASCDFDGDGTQDFTPCAATSDCLADEFCDSACCVPTIIIPD